MRYISRSGLMACAVVAIAASAAYTQGSGTNARNAEAGFVYVMTNLPSGNSVAVFRRAETGELTPAGTFPTGGLGNGTLPDPLQSQGGLVLKGQFLFAVNAGSNEISVLRIEGSELALASKVRSGGTLPTSLAVGRDIVYVVNAGSGTIAGFRLDPQGSLKPIPNSIRDLTGGVTAGPSQVSFDPEGKLLLVTEKVPNLIDVFTVTKQGLTGGPFPVESAGLTPFGFGFDDAGNLLVSEAHAGEPNAGTVSSYAVSDDSLSVISAAVPNDQTAPCWLVTTGNGSLAYTTNTGSASVSSYRVGPDGALELLESVAGNTTPGGAPIDMALDRSGRFLYALVNVTGTVSGFRVGEAGSLEPIGDTTGLPPFAQGIAAR
jgi:6-phosphogluconolactonase